MKVINKPGFLESGVPRLFCATSGGLGRISRYRGVGLAWIGGPGTVGTNMQVTGTWYTALGVFVITDGTVQADC